MSLPASQTRATTAARGYGSRWQRARETFLSHNPLCRLCAKQGRTAAATVVDHIEPHRGDQAKFWDKTNWQALCKLCHDSAKQREEKSGIVVGSDTTGMPLDPDHPWNKKCQADAPSPRS